MKSRLFFKIFAAYFILILLIVAVLDFLYTPRIREALTQNIESRLVRNGQIITLLSKNEIRGRISELADFADARVTLIDAAGSVVADSDAEERDMDNHLNRSELQEARLKGQGRAVRYSRTLEAYMLYVALPIKKEKNIVGYVRLARPLEDMRQTLEQAYRYVYLALLLVTLPCLLLAFFFARAITVPIQRLSTFLQRLRSGEPPGPLILNVPEEIDQLSRNMTAILREQEEKLREAQDEAERLRAAFAAMTEGVLILDGGGRILVCNEALRRMLGRTGETLEGKTLLEALRSAPLQEALERFRRTGFSETEEIVLGEDHPMVAAINLADIRGKNPDERKIIVVFHDITRLKNLERMRSDFIANVTHELKTPLTAIIGYVETLQENGSVDIAVQERFLRIVHDHARRLDRLVDDLLTLSSLEQGDYPLETGALSLETVLEETLPVVQAGAAAKGLTLTTSIPADLPSIRGDRDKVGQILLNLLDNAVKFTEAGGIDIRSHASQDGSQVTVEISDTGIGIPKADLPRLGERFYRVDRTRSRELGGTGLGLSIVKHLIMAHRGRLEIESNLGRGTTVKAIFPVSRGD